MATAIRATSITDSTAVSVDTPIGEILLNAGMLTQQDISKVVAAQRIQGLRFGEAALSLGLVQEGDIRRALSRQFDYPYAKSGESSLDPLLVAAYEPFGTRAEALRGLRSQLAMRWFNEPGRMLAVVAPRAGSGCSTVAANLAVLFAQQGERTLVIDANLRAPAQQRLFGLQRREGLSDLLGGRGSLKNALCPVESFGHLSVLSAGADAPNPQELLTRLTFAYIMEAIPASFDVVIIDTPPTLEYADAQLIAARTTGCLLVTRRHDSRISDIERTRAQLESSGASLVGAVVTD